MRWRARRSNGGLDPGTREPRMGRVGFPGAIQVGGGPARIALRDGGVHQAEIAARNVVEAVPGLLIPYIQRQNAPVTIVGIVVGR